MNDLYLLAGALAVSVSINPGSHAADRPPSGPWKLGTPIVTYWCGPSLTEVTAHQMTEGGWNLVWCGEKELEVAHRHGLR